MFKTNWLYPDRLAVFSSYQICTKSRKGPDVTRASEASRPAGMYNAISLVANLKRTLGKSAGTNMLVYLPWGKFDRDSRKMCQNSTYVVCICSFTLSKFDSNVNGNKIIF